MPIQFISAKQFAARLEAARFFAIGDRIAAGGPVVLGAALGGFAMQAKGCPT